MYRRIKQTEFGVGYINGEYLVSYPGEFNHENNVLEKTIKIDTYYDEMTGLTLYNYNDKLVTTKELRREYLKDYYNVK